MSTTQELKTWKQKLMLLRLLKTKYLQHER